MKEQDSIFISKKASFFWAVVAGVALGGVLLSVMSVLFTW